MQIEPSDMKAIPEMIIKAEEKAGKETAIFEKFTYTGDVLEQLKVYEKNGKEVLATMIVHYAIKASTVKELFAEETYLQRHQALKSKVSNLPEIRTILQKFDDILNLTFDQYEGLCLNG